MVKLARNEQCITLYPLTPIIPLGCFQPKLSFGLLRAHLFLGSFPAFGYLRPVTVIFCLWAKFSPWLQSAHLWPDNTLGRFHVKNPLGYFHRVIKYGLLMARYYPRIVWPMIGEMMIRPVEGPWILRPVKGPRIVRPVEGPWILRPV